MQLNDYPFSAIVGQPAMKTALLLNAVDPSIGGVLIRGQKGTAKSTTARALANLLPAIEAVAGCPYHCPGERPEQMHNGCLERFNAGETLAVEQVPTPLVELPLGATEDRMAGSFDLDKTLKMGRRHFEPGLLAAANRGILYVDEVNLLEDHLVDLLLDAAASGVNRVEREGFQLAHPARFVLIGTMNPEEGELRPQFLDRFGLVVSVAGLTDRQMRRQLIQYRLRFEQDPAGFVEEWATEEAFLARQVASAQQALDAMVLPSQTVQLAADLALQSNVQGHRAEIILVKAARALAALMGKAQVEETDIREVAWFALPHRLPEGLSVDSARRQEALWTALDNGGGEGELGRLGEKDGGEEDFYAGEFPGAAAAGSMLFETFKKKTSEQLINIADEVCLRPLKLQLFLPNHAQPGRSERRLLQGSTGRFVRSVPLAGERLTRARIDLPASLIAGLLRQGPNPYWRHLKPVDLRRKVCQQKAQALIVFVVDASASMGEGAIERIKAAKGAILGWLLTAYQQRDQVALVVFQGQRAEIPLPPTSSVLVARQCLRQLPVGGATPFADGLYRAGQLVRTTRMKQARLKPKLVILSDGEANVPRVAGADVANELFATAAELRREHCGVLVIDTGSSTGGKNLLQSLAGQLDGHYQHVHDLDAGSLLSLLRSSKNKN